MSSCHCFGKSNQRFKLSNCNFISMFLIQFFSLSYLFIFIFKHLSTFFCKFRSDSSAEFNVSLNFFHFKIWIESLIFKSMHIDNVLSYLVIFIIIFFIKYKEKYIETWHNWSWYINIKPQCSCSIISSIDGISCS